ncbi:hypothetical protein Leryth_001143 [Lithospermum erythrorhizon]|nr:hypothetical protein Leryth_001143 [Lithospermum erythrorhizon]
MFVQDRVAPKPQIQKNKIPTSASRFGDAKSLDFSTWVSDNLYKIIIFFVLIVGVVGVFYIVNFSSDTAALLCLQSTQSHSHPSKPPQIEYNKIVSNPDKYSQYSLFRSDQWIVVSVSDYPSKELIKLSKIKGWQLIAVGNSRTPKDWSLKGTIFLSLELQVQLGYRIVDYLPYDSYIRKNVGYLFAIQHGAKKIFDVDDRGERSVWPRGLPLENVGQIEHEQYYTEVFGGKQFIQQGISNGLPDVDSVFYFTRKAELEAFDIKFDERAPKVAFPQGSWSCDIPFRRKDLHVNVGRLIKFLIGWRSSKHRLFEKILELSYAMAEEGFWTEKDVKFTAAWLQDLLSVGYQQPRLMSLELDLPRATIGHGDKKEFVPQKLPSVHLGVEEIGTVNYEIGNLIRWRKYFGNVVMIMFCNGPVERTALEWRLLYGRIFKTVIILSKEKNVDLAVEAGQLEHIYKKLPKILRITAFCRRLYSSRMILFLITGICFRETSLSSGSPTR